MGRFATLSLRVFRLGIELGALALVLLALYVAVGRELVPLVAEYRGELEARVREAIGQPVSVGRLEGEWSGFAPRVIARDIEVGEGDSAIHLDRVRLVPALWDSLLARAPRLASVEVEGLRLILREDAEGHWALEGWPLHADRPPLDPARAIELMGQVGEASLLDSQVTLQPFGGDPVALNYIDLTLRGGADRQRLDGRLTLPDGQPLALRLQTRLHAQAWRDSEAELYLSLPQSDWATLLPASLTRDWHVERLRLGGEFWLSWAQGAVQRGVGRLHAPEIRGAYAERPAEGLQDLAVTAYLSREGDDYRLLLDSLAATVGDTRWGPVKLSVYRQRETDDVQGEWRVAADRLDLHPLATLVRAWAPLPKAAEEALVALRPRGAVRNLNLGFRPQREGDQRLTFSANLERVAFAAYHGAPAAENVSGSVAGDLGQGELRLDTRDFGLHLDQLFPGLWRYREAHARLGWRLDSEAVTLVSPYLQVVGDEGKVAGDFLIRLMFDPQAEDYMDLRVGLREGDARYTEKYLPTVSGALSPALADWLKGAIKGGVVEQGFFQYQGSLNKGAAETARSLSLFFKVHDAELAYQPGWPALQEGRGEVFVEDSGVRVRLSDGRILDSRVREGRADVPHVAVGATPHLLLDAGLDSSVGDGLKILQGAPLGLAETFGGWQGEGALDGRLRLDIPLGKGEAPSVVVDFKAQDAHLKLDKPDLDLRQVKGAFRYDLATGLSAADIRAKVFGRDVRGKALAEGRNGQAVTRIQADGSVPVSTLGAWLGVDPKRALPVSGELPYRLDLAIGANSQLQVDSDLNGVAIDLPAPYGKSAQERRGSQWRMSLGGSEAHYAATYQGLASLALAVPGNDFAAARGELRLGGDPARLPSSGQGIWLRGQLSEFDLDAWQEARQRYLGGGEGDGGAQSLAGVQVQVARFEGFGEDLENLGIDLTRAQAGWRLGIDSAFLQGRVLIPDARDAPVDLDLSRLRLPKPPSDDATADAAPDPLAHFDPRSLPPLNVRIGQVSLGDEPLGAWSFKARPVAKGSLFSDISLALKGVTLTGSAGWEATPAAGSSWFQGRMEGDNLADVLLAWKFAPTATSERFRLDLDGRWPGSPAWVSLKRFSGSLDASLHNGRFVEVEGGAQALRVFGLLNFNSIGRRLRLDFSDLLSKGLAYDRVKGLLVGSEGVYVTRKPIVLEGPSSGLELEGTLDMANDRIDARLRVSLPVTNNLPIAALIVGAPAIGGALFVVDKLLGDKVARFASVQYRVEGPWQSPQIKFAKPFESAD
ncbi:YhdP family protein [Pseudomonas sp. RIT-PI-AD]|uniref:YhdP family protein n=1 Tax=Pseudomonas sp. RIT-PI-AD TaxID=3035294 RepID=UPI0021D9326E|nr:YhdP family protein [Pseudomonas sp. RIT-PI-AD]